MAPEDTTRAGTRAKDDEQEKSPDLRRKGRRRNTGADTPAGSNTDRSSTPARQERERQEKEGVDVYPPDEEKK